MGPEALLDGLGALPKAALLEALEQLVEPLSQTLPQPSEVLLHDLDKLPNSIVAIAGNLTGRRVGGAATDMLLRRSANGQLETLIGYPTTLPDGRQLKSTTIIVRDDTGAPAAAFCLNIDVTMFQAVRTWCDTMTPGAASTAPAAASHSESETFVTDLDTLGTHMLADAIATVNVPLDLMRKPHKLAVVAELKSEGFFLLKESVGTAAKALGVTRFTIYNYLNELSDQRSAD